MEQADTIISAGIGEVPAQVEKGLTTYIGRRLKEAYVAGAQHEELPPAIVKSLAGLRAAEATAAAEAPVADGAPEDEEPSVPPRQSEERARSEANP